MKVAILGYGKSGKSAESLLKKKGIVDIDIFDDKIIEFKTLKEFYHDNYETVVLSPGIDPNAVDVPKGKISSELEIAFEFISNKKIIGITGTNGKSTVTFLTSQILKNLGVNAEFCGNIGRTVGDTFLTEDPDIYVVEVSSFQLDLLNNFRFDTACITNITPDHLNRYKTMNNYILSKKRIADFTTGTLFLEKGEWNNYFKGGSKTIFIDPYMKIYPKFDGKILSFGKFFVEIDKYRLFGFHNLLNLSFSLVLSDQIIPLVGNVSHLVENLKPLEHRCEFITEINGVKYINDSKGTNVDSTLTALKSSEYPTTLILGGKDKDGDFSALIDEINSKTKMVICCGEAGEKIYRTLKGNIKAELVKVDKLKDALMYAYRETEEGTVLFSPACASFDEFNNFEERGRFFKQWVLELKEKGC